MQFSGVAELCVRLHHQLQSMLTAPRETCPPAHAPSPGTTGPPSVSVALPALDTLWQGHPSLDASWVLVPGGVTFPRLVPVEMPHVGASFLLWLSSLAPCGGHLRLCPSLQGFRSLPFPAVMLL